MTQMKRHRQTCQVWKTRHRGTVQMARLADTLQAKHGEGVIHPNMVPGAEERRQTTNRERYGAENVFCRESSIFDDVQAAQEGKRPVLKGQDNPFAWPEVQEKIRQTNLERYGVEHSQQSPEVRARTQATNLGRCGCEETLAAPEVRTKIAATNQERYGGPTPAHSPEVVEKARQTNLKRWGVEWTCQNPDVRRRQFETMAANYGGGHFFASEEGRKRLRQALVERYGVEHALQSPEIYERFVRTSIERYGVPHAMMNKDVARRALEAAARPGPNKFEAKFASLNPSLLYTGNGTFWRWLPKLGHHKNPDFILPGPDSAHPKKGVTKVIELFGDYWHSRMFTGSANFDHEQQLIDAFADIGLACLVIWESEFKADPEACRQRVQQFLLVDPP